MLQTNFNLIELSDRMIYLITALFIIMVYYYDYYYY